MSEEGQQSGFVAFEGACRFDHGFQARVGSPEVPVLPVVAPRLLVAVLPEVAQVLFDGPRAAGFQVRTAESDETLAVFRGEILLRVQPQVLRTGQALVARRPPGEATREWVASLALTVAPPH